MPAPSIFSRLRAGVAKGSLWWRPSAAILCVLRGSWGRVSRCAVKGAAIQPAEAALREVTMATLSPALPTDLLQAALEAGRALALDEAAAEALADTRVL